MSEVPLKEHLEKQIGALDRYVDERIASMKSAIDVAEEKLGHRLEGMNEFRSALKDQASRLAAKEEVDYKLSAIEGRIKDLELAYARGLGRATITSVLWSTAIAIAILGLGYLLRAKQ
ncbi:MAG TPA: hypothetical protein VF077_12925 [Nitrospiraceae bacterium]